MKPPAPTLTQRRILRALSNGYIRAHGFSFGYTLETLAGTMQVRHQTVNALAARGWIFAEPYEYNFEGTKMPQVWHLSEAGRKVIDGYV